VSDASDFLKGAPIWSERANAPSGAVDATESELELRRKKRALAALIVHDMRSPLAALHGYLQLAQHDVATGASIEVVVARLDDCRMLVERALSLVSTMLDVDELEDGMLKASRTKVRIADMIDSIYRLLAAGMESRGLRFVSRVAPETELMIDRDLMWRVMENLIDNGTRYVQRGGRVEVSLQVADRWVEMTVGNSGPPVPASERESIFGRYFQVEARRAAARANRGLGLYFCKLAVEAHDGQISVETRGELGAVFVVRMPVSTSLPSPDR
jgi:two-component system, OmpR family, heavy metal sensor histidine kinase CusS